MEDAPKKAGIRITDLLGKRWEDRPSFLEEPRMKWLALEARPVAGGGGCGRWEGAWFRAAETQTPLGRSAAENMEVHAL